MRFYLYILHSRQLNKYYVGHTSNIEERLKSHLYNHLGFTSKAKDGSSQKLVGFRDYAKIVVSLNRKKSTFLTPLNCALKALIFALNDSAEALVLRLSK
ncbi:hypothetical protein ES724_14570 [Gillisia hiemivivida]|uniref:GIY-YIG domain-containing protein n=1 Tax=Gillisia hiemivivida TaxID=291190 RepID=A0A5C6ZPT7_9FLAO|nr:hypothetical protein ES724_14570 [Gillisia hiemivivida]